MRNIFEPIVVLGLLLALLGCAPAQSPTQERPVAGEKQGERTEPRFDPLGLQGDSEIIPRTHPHSGDIQGQVVTIIDTIASSTDTTSTYPTVVEIPLGVDTIASQAFRIQLFTSKLYGDARRQLIVAEEIFDRPLYLDYEVPYYKLRVGSFGEREPAEDYLMKVKATGYPNAWVAIVNVNVRQATPLYDEWYSEDDYEALPTDGEPETEED